MASLMFKYVYSGFLRHYLLIFLLILLVHALCTDSADDTKKGQEEVAKKGQEEVAKKGQEEVAKKGQEGDGSSNEKTKLQGKLPEVVTITRKLRRKTRTTPTLPASREQQNSENKARPNVEKTKLDLNDGSKANSQLGRVGATDALGPATGTGGVKRKSDDKGKETSEEKKVLGSKRPDEPRSSGFMSYFIVSAVVVVVVYLVFHNRHKLMGYIVEGRSSSHGRRRRAQTTNDDYKPLNNDDEAGKINENA